MRYRYNNSYNNNYDKYPKEDKHVHELLGSVKTADQDDPHQHRFCTVTSRAIPCGDNDHIHEVEFRTDTFDNHNHEFCGKTGGAIRVGDRHVHFIESMTTVEDGHRHNFQAATLIENPTGFDHHDHYHEDSCDYKDRHDSNRHY